MRAGMREVAPPEQSVEAATRPPSRAGRDVPVALGVGLALATMLAVPLFTVRPIFVAIVAAAAGYGVVELVVALRRTGLRPPLPPLVVGGVVTTAVGYPFGSEAVLGALLVTVGAAVAWRVAQALAAGRGPGDGWLVRDLAAAVFTATYVPFLAGFAVLLAAPSDGPRRVMTFIATAVASDVGGFAAGVLSGGRHKLAPAISPGKSWEGLAGSLVAGVVAGVCFLGFLLHRPAWEGVAYGLAVVACATLGDLAESALKRDIGVKDMGRLLPGHGGLLDRLDSLLVTAPVAWLLLSAFAPVG